MDERVLQGIGGRKCESKKSQERSVSMDIVSAWVESFCLTLDKGKEGIESGFGERLVR